MKTKMILFMLTGITSTAINAQVMGNWRYNGQPVQQRQIQQIVQTTVSGDTEISFKASALLNANTLAYVATFNVSQVGSNLKDVVSKSDDRIRGFIEDLKNIGVDTNDITVDMISMIPVYDYEVEKKLFSKSYNEIPVGFELQKNIIIRYDYNSQLDYIVKSAVNNEIYDLVKVDYFVDNIEGIKDTLRQRTLAYYHKKLSELNALGIDFDTLYPVFSENYQTIVPHSRYNSYTAFSRPSLHAMQGKTLLGTDNRVKNTTKLKTLYYNPVSYTDFDIVINPVVVEPVVQFTYDINIKFIIKSQEKPNPEKKYYFLNQNGNIQQLYLQ